MNIQIFPPDDSSVSLNAKNYLSLDWHPKAKPKFFNEKAAEEFNQDESYHGRATPKKQVRSGGTSACRLINIILPGY